MTMQPDGELLERIATCHTEDCVNVDIPIEVFLVDENTTVHCGPCGQLIEDIVEA
jgi:hypothetical protein